MIYQINSSLFIITITQSIDTIETTALFTPSFFCWSVLQMFKSESIVQCVSLERAEW